MQMFFALTLIFVTALFYKPSVQVVLAYLLSLVCTVGADIALLKIRRIKPFFPSAALVTGSIIGLLHSPTLPLYEVVVVAIIAMLSKHFLKRGKQHIFNPASLGLFIVGILFSHNVSWWGGAFQTFSTESIRSILFFLILLIPGYISLVKVRKVKIILPFLICYSLLNYVFNGFFPLFDPTVLFFALIMLPEPMTTPTESKAQVLFGIVVAVVSLVISLPLPFSGFRISDLIPDPLVTALLIGNLAFLKWR